jgi:RNA polymerase sigma factor (TIGR02999 family)
MIAMSDVTQVLQRIESGDPSAAGQLLPLAYDELRKLASTRLAREKSGQTLQATALVHEAYLRLVGDQSFENRRHFFGAAAEAMRRILVENGRRKQRLRHGGEHQKSDLDPEQIAAPEPDDDLLALDEALTRLGREDPLKGHLVELRYFAGMTGDQAAEILGISPSAADRHWTYARAWLRRELQKEGVGGES